ncbi:MAG: TlpA disulfide reductase family protein [bacterium]
MALVLLVGARASFAQPTRVSYATRTFAGAEIRIGAGEPATVVAVFATWCTTCRNEFGTLDSLQAALAPRGIRVLALSVDEKDDAHVRRYTDARHTRVLIARDASGAVGKSFGTVGVPEAYLVDTKGVIRWRGRGDLQRGVADLRRVLKDLD